MNIKSLILGSATVALATAGAHAADAIVFAEPEPVEYVRVCDVYGAGFFYIPGTETCLRIGGEVRYQVGTAATSDINVPGVNAHGHKGLADDTWTKHSRARIFFDARSETELGLLRSYVRLDTSRTAGDNNTYLNHAWLSLGGFRAGWTDSAWFNTPHSGVANTMSHSDDLFYSGYHQAHLIQYNFSGSNGFFATISLEDDNRAGHDYTPDIVGVVGINQAWGGAWLKVGYDSDIRSPNWAAFGTPGYYAEVDTNESGFGVTAGLHYNIPGAPGSSFRLLGFYADSDNKYNPMTGTGHARWDAAGGLLSPDSILVGGPEWSIQASYHHQFNAQFGASIGVQYFNDFYFAGTDVSTGLDGWALELVGVWTPVKDFTVRTEVVYSDFDTLAPGVDGDSLSGWVRFSRFF